MSTPKDVAAQATEAMRLAGTELARLEKQVISQSKQINMYQEAYEEVCAQRDHIYNLLCEIQLCMPERELQGSVKSTWAGRPNETKVRYHSKDGLECLPMQWISTPDTRKQLGKAEVAWKANQPQQTIIALDRALRRGLQGEARINAHLLRSVVFRAAKNYNSALDDVSTALSFSGTDRLYHLRGKSQYFRAWCLFEMGRSEEAKWALSLAVGLSPYEDHIEILQGLIDESVNGRKDKKADIPPSQESFVTMVSSPHRLRPRQEGAPNGAPPHEDQSDPV